MTRDGSRSQFNSSNYMPLKFGLRGGCMVCAFWKRRRLALPVSGARESAENVGRFLAPEGGSRCALPLSPLMQGSVSLCLAVLFSSGDLEVSNSAIQIHCARYTLSSNPPISPLLLTFSSLFVSSPPRISSLLIFLPYNPVCTILPLSPPLFLSYLITSPRASVFSSPVFFVFVILPFPFPSSSPATLSPPIFSQFSSSLPRHLPYYTLPFLLLLSPYLPLSNLHPFSNPCCLPISPPLHSLPLLPPSSTPPSPRLPTNSPYRLLQNPPEPFPPSSQHIAADTSQSFLRFIAALFRARLTISCRADSHTLLGNMSPCCWIQNISFYEFIKT